MRLYVLGIDPGTTAAFSLIELDGTLRYIFSKRNISVDELIDQIVKILENDKLVFVACDKKKVPKSVEKISQRFGVKVVSPNHDLSFLEKKKLISEFYGNPDFHMNIHEIDALASALYVIKKFTSKINHAIGKLKENANLDISSYLYDVLTTNKSTVQIISELSKNFQLENINERTKEKVKKQSTNYLMKRRLQELERELNVMKEKLRSQRRNLLEKEKNKFLILTSKIYNLNNEIDSLKNELKNALEFLIILFNYIAIQNKNLNFAVSQKLFEKLRDHFLLNKFGKNIKYYFIRNQENYEIYTFQNSFINSLDESVIRIKLKDFIGFEKLKSLSKEDVEALINEYKMKRKHEFI